MADCTAPRCLQERRAVRRELQRWTKNMVYVLGLERVAEELMGRRKWKLYQDALLPRPRSTDSETQRGAPADPERPTRAPAAASDDDMPAAEAPAPALKIKTIEQINTARDGEEQTTLREESAKPPPRTETILESLIKRPATQPRLPDDDWRPACAVHRRISDPNEPQDWKPADRCYFCEVRGAAGETGGVGGASREGGASSPAASESDSSSSGEARSPAAAAPAAPPPLLAHLLQLHNHNPQAIAQFQQMMAALAALGSGLMPQAALSQALILQRLNQNQLQLQRQHVDRLTTDMGEKVSVSSSSPVFPGAPEQPLDLSARSGSSAEPGTPPPPDTLASRVPPIDAKLRLKRPASAADSPGNTGRRAYTEDELQSALRDIQSGRLGTRRAAVLYGIPRSTLRNKAEREPPLPAPPADDDSPGVILKIPTFPLPERDDTPPPRLPDLPFAPLAFASPHAPAPSGETLFSLRDVIAKSISQKFQQPGEREHELGMPAHRAPPDRISVIKHLTEPPRAPHPGYQQHQNSRAPPSNNGGAPGGAGGKGTRPKRGKYRNYDRDSLVEAVKAVQRGEMSVHRAGSYYGVPHSTLEYKVKERHLMRPRKREPKPQPDATGMPKMPQPGQKPLQPPTKPHAKPPFPNGINGPESLAASPYPHPQPPYGFWSGTGVGAAFPPFAPGGDFASHMMQRLRDESAPPPQANGSSFLEGIIRSSLERPGALLQRLTEPPVPPVSAANSQPTFNAKANSSLLQRLSGEAPAPGALLLRLSGEGGGGTREDDRSEEGSPPPARRPRLSSSDRQLAVEMREAVQRLRAAAAGRNGTPTPPAPHTPLAAPADRA